MILIGTKKQVYYSTEPMRTAGGLTKDKLCLNRYGKVVSKARSLLSKQSYRLKKYQFIKKDDGAKHTPTEQ